MTRGIDAAAVYLPHYRLEAEEVTEAWGQADMTGIARKAVPAPDEDAVTMAVEAGRRVLDGHQRAVDHLAIATTTPPLEEDALQGRILRALGLGEATETLLATGDTAAGAAALSRALDASGTALVLIADAPEGDLAGSDHRLGGGAAGLLVDDDAAVTLVNRGSYTDERPGVRYRPEGDRTVETIGITQYERGAVRNALRGAMRTCADEEIWADVAGIALHQPDGGLPYRMVGALPVDESAVHAGTVVGDLGDLGAATVPIGLASLLATEDGRLGTCFFGGGSATAFVFDGSLEAVPGLHAIDAGETISYTSYLRMREALGTGDVPGGGAHVSLPNWQQSIPQRYRLRAGRCTRCGGLNFPPTGACQHCHTRADTEPVHLDVTGEISALTVIGHGGAPPEFASQQRQSGAYAAAIVSLSGGGESVRIPAQVVDCDPDDLAVGDAVHASFRRIYTQEGIVRYGLKFVPFD